jgi:muconolactone D-isomerase
VSEEFHHPYLNNTHRAIILPFREDQRTYMGILNFRATPVEAILGQRVPVDNATLSMVEKKFGDLEEGNITHGTVKVLADGAVLKPQYGDSPQSIPFIADSIVLRANQPFVAKAGYLVRLWRPPLGLGECRSIGRFRAADETELDKILASSPLHTRMKVTITPLTPHPNDPENLDSQV